MTKCPPLVEITWLDAVTRTEAMAISDVPRQAVLAERVTSGYLLHENLDGRLILAHTYDVAGSGEHEDSVADVTVIPFGWVQRIRRRSRRPRAAREAPCPVADSSKPKS
jgi:hypothetical protein